MYTPFRKSKLFWPILPEEKNNSLMWWRESPTQNLILAPYQYKSNLHRPKGRRVVCSARRTNAHNSPAFLGFAFRFGFLFEILDTIAKSSSIRLAQSRLLGSDCYRWLCCRYCLGSTKQIEGWHLWRWRLSYQCRKIKKLPDSRSPDNWRKKMKWHKLWTARPWNRI